MDDCDSFAFKYRNSSKINPVNSVISKKIHVSKKKRNLARNCTCNSSTDPRRKWTLRKFHSSLKCPWVVPVQKRKPKVEIQNCRYNYIWYVKPHYAKLKDWNDTNWPIFFLYHPCNRVGNTIKVLVTPLLWWLGVGTHSEWLVILITTLV